MLCEAHLAICCWVVYSITMHYVLQYVYSKYLKIMAIMILSM